MISIFGINNNILIVNPQVLLIEEFNDIWNMSDDKEMIKSTHFKFIELYCSPYKTNIYADLDSLSRHKMLCKEIYKDEDYDLPREVKRAIFSYGSVFLENIFVLTLLDAAMNSASEVRNELNRLDLQKTTKSGAKVTKVNDVFIWIEKLEAAVVSIENLKKRVYQDLKKVKLKGNTKIGFYER